MKIAFSLLFLFWATLAIAVAPQRPVIVSYPNDTPNSVLEEAKDAIMKAVCRKSSPFSFQILNEMPGWCYYP